MFSTRKKDTKQPILPLNVKEEEDESENEENEFMKGQYPVHEENGKADTRVEMPVYSCDKNGDTCDENIAFVASQYSDSATPPVPTVSGDTRSPVKAQSHQVTTADNDEKKFQAAEAISTKDSSSGTTTTPMNKYDPATRKANAKKRALDEYHRLAAEKKQKEQEDYIKHQAFLADVEHRRRTNVLINKANRKRNAIFASQKNGLRLRLCAEWPLLSEEQRISTRALRARRNIKCEKCGTLGYFTEICPNNCTLDDDDDSLNEVEKKLCKPQLNGYNDYDYEQKAEECEGFLWGTNTTYAHEALKPEREKIHRGNMKANLNPLRHNANVEKETLQQLDEGLPGYAYNSLAEDGYHRDLSEMTLHKVLRYVMRVMENVITKNAEKLESEKDFDLFHPPLEKPGSNFYPKEIWDIKEHRDYLTKQAVKKDRRVNQAHSHQGAIRPDEAMGAYYRGGSSKELNALYHPNKKAGQSMHSKIGWKSTLSKSDDLAIADPKMQAKVDAMDKLMEKQKAWTRIQKRAFENTNERFIHMWNIVKEEVTKEHDREYRLLSVDVHSNLYETKRDVWVERLDAADRIIETLLRYKYINGTSEADYALQSLQKWRHELKESMTRTDVQPPGQSNRVKKKHKKKRLKAKKMFAKMGMSERQEEDDEDEDSDGDDVSLSSMSMDSVTRVKMANLGTQMTTSSKGGYKGLGFASEFEVVKEVDSYDCNAAITAALLTGGANSLFEKKSPKKGDKTEFKKTVIKSKMKSDGTERAIFQKLKLKYKEPQSILDRRMMADKEGKYAAVGMVRNIRGGTNEDNTQCTPALIPIHEVFSATRNDHIQSTVAQQIVLRARLSRTNDITGHVGKEYVPMYVRNTLFEKNGTSEGGDQTYENMGKDSRYSGQLGRTMQALEPSKSEQKHLKKKMMQSTYGSSNSNSSKEKKTKNLPNVKPSAANGLSTHPAPTKKKGKW